jgi:hypothetical protein
VLGAIVLTGKPHSANLALTSQTLEHLRLKHGVVGLVSVSLNTKKMYKKFMIQIHNDAMVLYCRGNPLWLPFGGK